MVAQSSKAENMRKIFRTAPLSLIAIKKGTVKILDRLSILANISYKGYYDWLHNHPDV